MITISIDLVDLISIKGLEKSTLDLDLFIIEKKPEMDLFEELEPSPKNLQISKSKI